MLKPNRWTLCLSSLVCLIFCGCQLESESHCSTPATFPKMQPEPAVVAANAFGCDLFRKLATDEKNVLLSPTSLMLALSMVYNGAGGETKTAMAGTLHVSDIPTEDLNRQLVALQRALQAPDNQVQLDIASSLWARQDLVFRPQFAKLCDRQYHASLQALDFLSPGAAEEINAWAAEKTKGRILEIVDQSDLVEAGALLLNAIYFKGQWSNQFSPWETKEADFTLPTGKTKKVRMMRQYEEYVYGEDSRRQAVALPYASGRLNMIIVLPRDRKGLPGLLKTMGYEAWQKLLAGMTKLQGTVGLPRFEVACKLRPEAALKALGMGAAFRYDADFSAISPDIQGLTFVRHNTFLRVIEEGTEAAAVGGPGLAPGMPPVPPVPPFEMIVNHPFLLAVVDSQTGALLFLGAIDDPQEAPTGN
ncbi:MAG: serpin family protein [Armatimonadia bacterium]